MDKNTLVDKLVKDHQKNCNPNCIYHEKIYSESCIKCFCLWFLNREITFKEYIEDVKELASYYMGDIYVAPITLEKEHPEIMYKYTDDKVKDELVESVNNKINTF